LCPWGATTVSQERTINVPSSRSLPEPPRRERMSQIEWLASCDPAPMLESISDRCPDSLFRLFAVACARRVWPLMNDERARNAVEVAERFATGDLAESELIAAHAAITSVAATNDAPGDLGALGAAWCASHSSAWYAAYSGSRAAARAIGEVAMETFLPLSEPRDIERHRAAVAIGERARIAELGAQAALLRDLVASNKT
jgi:hypothetical protein